MFKNARKKLRKCTAQVSYTLGWTCCGGSSSAFPERGSDTDTEDDDGDGVRSKFVEIDLLRPDLNAERKFPDNSIRTAKYTLFTGLPLSLLYQFHKVSNVYFLLVMVVSLVPGASPINPFSSIAPLCVVLGAGIIKDLWEDWKRRKADTAANNMIVHVLNGNEFAPVKSSEVRPGDVMLFRLGEEVKADCLILNTSLPDGLTYIETANLDGETNAKTRRAKVQTVELLGTVEDINDIALSNAQGRTSTAAAGGRGGVTSKVEASKNCCGADCKSVEPDVHTVASLEPLLPDERSHAVLGKNPDGGEVVSKEKDMYGGSDGYSLEGDCNRGGNSNSLGNTYGERSVLRQQQSNPSYLNSAASRRRRHQSCGCEEASATTWPNFHRPTLSADGTVELSSDEVSSGGSSSSGGDDNWGEDGDGGARGRWLTREEREARRSGRSHGGGSGSGSHRRRKHKSSWRTRTASRGQGQSSIRSSSGGGPVRHRRHSTGEYAARPPRSLGLSSVNSLSELQAGSGHRHQRYHTLDDRMELEGAMPVPQEIMDMSRRYEEAAAAGGPSRHNTPFLVSLRLGGTSGGDGGHGGTDRDLLLALGADDTGSTPSAGKDGEESLHPPRPVGMERGGVVILGSAPSPDLSSWYGQLRVAATGEMVPCGIDQFLPRGCIIRNTDWVLAAVLYTGKDTKMLLNLRPKPTKTTRMTRRLNQLNIFLFILNQVLMFLLCGLAVWYTGKMRRKTEGLKTNWTHWYLQWNLHRYSDAKLFWWRYLTNFVLLSFLIPMSLYVTLEFNKAMQMLMIGGDKRMAVFDEFTGKVRKSRPKTSELNCQLGQVEYIFTDKTGTLTENLMTYVGGYAANVTHDEREKPGGMGKLLLRKVGMSGGGGGGAGGNSMRSRIPSNIFPAHHGVLSLDDDADDASGGAWRGGSGFLSVPSEGQYHLPTLANTDGNIVGDGGGGGEGEGTDGEVVLRPVTSLTNVVRHAQRSSISIEVDTPTPTHSLPQALKAASDGPSQPPPRLHTFGKYTEAELESDETYRYLRAMALCHCVVCFDADTEDEDAGHGGAAKRKKKAKKGSKKSKKKTTKKGKERETRSRSTGGGSSNNRHHHSTNTGTMHEPTEVAYPVEDIAIVSQDRGRSPHSTHHHHHRVHSASILSETLNADLISLGRSSTRYFHVPNAVPAGPNGGAVTSSTSSRGAATPSSSSASSDAGDQHKGRGQRSRSHHMPNTSPHNSHTNNKSLRRTLSAGGGLDTGAGPSPPPPALSLDEASNLMNQSRTYSVSRMLHGRTGSASWYMNRYNSNATRHNHNNHHQRSGTAHSASAAALGGGGGGGGEPMEMDIDRSKIYEGQSLDEIALVSAARENGFALIQRTAKQMFIKVMGKVMCYDIIAELEFTPQRKLMSILLQRNPLGDSEAAVAEASAGGNASYHRQPMDADEGSTATTNPSITAKETKAGNDPREPFEPFEGVPPVATTAATPDTSAAAGGDVTTVTVTESPMDRQETRTYMDRKGTAATAATDYTTTDDSSPVERANSRRHGGGGGTSPPPPPGQLPPEAMAYVEAVKYRNSSSSAVSGAPPNEQDSQQQRVGGVGYPQAPPPYLLLVKGADSSMMDIANPHNPHNVRRRPVFVEQLDKMASQGLRTLVLGQKYLTEAEVRRWLPIYSEAQCAMSQRSERLHEAYALLERDIDLVGTTAVEDKLQEGVPETLEFMSQAGIVVWMLTGDKRETAVTIALTSGLVDQQHEDCVCHLDIADLIAEETIMKHAAAPAGDATTTTEYSTLPTAAVDGTQAATQERNNANCEDSAAAVAAVAGTPLAPSGMGKSFAGAVSPLHAQKCARLDEQLAAAEQKCAEAEANAEAQQQRTNLLHLPPDGDGNDDDGGVGGGSSSNDDSSSKVTVIVVDGKTLDFIFEDNERAHRFFVLGSRCRSAVCCRMTPLQKAQIVHMFQKNMKAVALAIGDGANDVSMIQESKIGVGIMGLEGSQAELASDYAIPKFRFLKRLLMVHGRFSIFRDAHCIVYSLYKNVVLTVGMIAYSFYSAYSGQAFIDSWLLAMFSIFFCSLQPLMIGILDKDVEDELAETLPQLYPPLSRENMYFSFPYIIKWIVDGTVEGAFFFFFVIYTCALKDDLYRSKSGGIEDYGETFFTMLVLVVDLRVGVLVTYYMILFALAIFVEIALLPVIQIIYSELHDLAGSNWCVYTAHALYGSGKFYLFLLFSVGVMVVYTMSTSLYIQMFYPWQNAGLAMMAARRSPYRRLHREERRRLKQEYRQRVGAFLAAEGGAKDGEGEPQEAHRRAEFAATHSNQEGGRRGGRYSDDEAEAIEMTRRDGPAGATEPTAKQTSKKSKKKAPSGARHGRRGMGSSLNEPISTRAVSIESMITSEQRQPTAQ